MSSKYNNILDAFAGSVWAIDEGKLNEIVAFVNGLSSDKIVELQRDYRKEQAALHKDEPQSLLESAGVTIDGNTAIVPIKGTIFKRANLFTQFSGGTSTELLTKAVRELEGNSAIANVVFHIDSPGGQVGGLSEAAAAIRSLRKTKNVVSVADGTMASAAYWLGSAANKVFATRDALVGNIGTLMVHEERSEQYEKEGRTFTIFRSAPLKGAGHPSEKLSDDAKAEFQKILDAFNSEFIRDISLNRNITIEQATQMADAQTHVGEAAVENNVADDVKTLSDVTDDLNAEDTIQAYQAEYTALVEQYDEAQATIEDLKAKLEKSVASSFENRVEAKVRELTEGPDAKFAPMQAEILRERLTADFDGTVATLALVATGLAAPKNGLPDTMKDNTDHSLEATIAKAQAEGLKIARSETMAAEFRAWGYVEGKDFIKGFEDSDE